MKIASVVAGSIGLIGGLAVSGNAVVVFDRGTAITPVVRPGQYPDSMFGSNTPGDGDRVGQAQLGVKWMRHNGVNPDDVARARGYNQLMITNTPPAEHTVNGQVFGAPKPEYIDTWIDSHIDILKKHPEIRAVEFYNEQWWMYQGGSMADFRNLLKRFYTRVKAYDPGLTILVGNSASSVLDDIAVDGGGNYADGYTNHIYQSTGALNAVDQPFWRYADMNNTLCVQNDKKQNWVTEGGEFWPGMREEGDKLHLTDHEVGMCMGFKQAQRHAIYPFVGVNKVFNHMHDPTWHSAEMFEVYKMMTTILEGKKPLMEVWPRSMITYGSVFEGEGQSAMLLWSWCGKELLKNDAGTVTVHDADAIAAYDVLGKPYGTYDAAAKTLTLPIGNMPIYLIGNIPGGQLAGAVKKAGITIPQPLKVMIEPFCGPVGPGTPLRVRIYNGGASPVDGVVDAAVPGWTLAKATPFHVELGDFVIVEVPVEAAAASPRNLYVVTATTTVTGSAQPQTVTQAVQAAYMTKMTPQIDGSLDDWKGMVPVSMASYNKGLDWGSLALNPALMSAATTGGQPAPQNALIKLYSAYDKDNLYIAYDITGKRGAWDWVQLALGVLDWSPHNMRAKTADYAYKGYYIDSDYIFALDNPAGSIWKLASPGAKFRTPYTWIEAATGPDIRFDSEPDYEKTVFYDMVGARGGKIASKDVNGRRIVECAIPRSEIPEFHPENGQPIRMSFIFHTSKGAAEDNSLYEWSKVAGDFSFMAGHGSFMHSWQIRYSNQLHWGVK